MMDFLAELPNTEFVFRGTVDDLLLQAEAAQSGVSVVSSDLWFDYDSPDNSHFDAYDAAFRKIGTAISDAIGEAATQQLGYDTETFEPIPFLGEHDIFADAFFHWPSRRLVLVSAQEDSELPVEIGLLRLP